MRRFERSDQRKVQELGAPGTAWARLATRRSRHPCGRPGPDHGTDNHARNVRLAMLACWATPHRDQNLLPFKSHTHCIPSTCSLLAPWYTILAQSSPRFARLASRCLLPRHAGCLHLSHGRCAALGAHKTSGRPRAGVQSRRAMAARRPSQSAAAWLAVRR